ncbi:BatD family protein [Hymenobacter saemangeumensis]|uniref:BatD family protein n=1 Tax=Hymenobacter saemangeumensis TaxID=1084522 RepID=A0ABP8ISP4_9BACT
MELVPGPASIAITEYYTLAFRLRGAPLGSYTPFPELEGFKKSGKTSTTTTRIVQGRSSTELTITQRYIAYGEGEQSIKPFQMTVNGVTVRSSGGTVKVGPAPMSSPAPTTSPANPQEPLQAVGDLDQLFGKPKPALYQDVPDHAYLAVEADRKAVYVGEGVQVGLYFYLQPSDQALLAFYDFSEQLPRLLRQLNQSTAWEVPAAELSATPDSVRRSGQLYLRYRLAEKIYYPLTTQPLRFPPLALTMTKFKMLKKPEPGVDGRLAAYKTYTSAGVGVAVKPLPPHPLREQVPVGSFQAQEAISRTSFRVGQSFTYSFGVEGRGNLAAVMAPLPTPYPGLDVYGPEVKESAVPGGGRRMFRYRLVARRPGVLPLDSVFQLIVFNPSTARYDTLRPGVQPRVQGAPPAPLKPLRPEDDPFYGPALAAADATLQPFDVYGQVRHYASWVLGALFLLALGGWATSKSKHTEQ